MLGLFVPLVLLPLVFLGFVIAEFAKRRPAVALQGLAFAALGVAAMIWAITQSRSSTAGIGFLGVPFGAALMGFLGLLFGATRTNTTPSGRIGWIASWTLAIVFLGMTLREGIATRNKNATRDVAQAAFSAEVARDRDSINAALKQRPGSERAWLDSAIRTRMKDRAFLLAALPHDSISAPLLDTLANSPDLGVTLEAMRNRSTASSTLERVYRTHTYPDYFFQALAAHPNTPPPILRDLYTRRPRTIFGLDVWLAGNPSTPRDVLTAIADSAREAHIIAQILENPSADCTVLGKLAKTLMKRQNKDADDANVARLAEKIPTVCASAKDSARGS